MGVRGEWEGGKGGKGGKGEWEGFGCVGIGEWGYGGMVRGVWEMGYGKWGMGGMGVMGGMGGKGGYGVCGVMGGIRRFGGGKGIEGRLEREGRWRVRLGGEFSDRGKCMYVYREVKHVYREVEKGGTGTKKKIKKRAQRHKDTKTHSPPTPHLWCY